MRYLYGDSTPFPLGYNFLTTIECFMTAATRIVQLEAEGALFAKRREALVQNRASGLSAIEQVHAILMDSVKEATQVVKHKHALRYARAVTECATQYIETHKREMIAGNERELQQLRSDGEHRVSQMRSEIEAFFKAARLPVSKTKLALVLNGDGRTARYSGTAVFEHPNGIGASFTIAAHRAASWSAARKVSDFVNDVHLMVGLEKSWLRGTVTAKAVNIDDWTITQVDISDDMFEIALRRKPSEKEVLRLVVRRDDKGTLTGFVEHPDAAIADVLPGSLERRDIEEIERIWSAMKTEATREALDEKERLVDVTLDGSRVFDNGLALPLVHRIVALLAPTVREITKRSPNQFELTLKTESKNGRREELYLRKDSLVTAMQPLPASGREVFSPLGLDTWVPKTTTSPPPVVVAPEVPSSYSSLLPPPARNSPVPAAPSIPPAPNFPRKI